MVETAEPVAVELADNAAVSFPQAPETVEYDSSYFTRIALDENGNVTGPWLIKYADTEVIALRIVSALDQVVVIEIQGREDQSQKIRIPYSKISACEAA